MVFSMRNGCKMQRVMEKFAVWAAVAIWLAPGAALAQDGWGEFTGVIGKVALVRGSTERPARPQLVLALGDRITTATESSADIFRKSDNARFRIGENATMAVADAGTTGRLDMTQGEILCNIRKLTSFQTFQVSTPTAVATIRGTAFSLGFNPGNRQTTLMVFKGVVELRVGDKIILVHAGNRIVTGEKLENKENKIPSGELRRLRKNGGAIFNDVLKPEGTPAPSGGLNKTGLQSGPQGSSVDPAQTQQALDNLDAVKNALENVGGSQVPVLPPVITTRSISVRLYVE
jgi:hypothetical protein